MDLVDYSQERFEEIRDQYLAFSEKLTGNTDIQIIPISALEGDNVVDKGQNLSCLKAHRYLNCLRMLTLISRKVRVNSVSLCNM